MWHTKTEQALLRLGTLGDDAIDVLIPNRSRSSPANRILLAEVAALTEERRKFDPNDDTALNDRMADLNDLERKFVLSLGLTWSNNDESADSV